MCKIHKALSAGESNEIIWIRRNSIWIRRGVAELDKTHSESDQGGSEYYASIISESDI